MSRRYGGRHALARRIRNMSTKARVAAVSVLGAGAAAGLVAATLGASAAQIGPVYNNQGNAGVELVNSGAQVRNLTATFYVTKVSKNLAADTAIHLEARNSGDSASLALVPDGVGLAIAYGPTGESLDTDLAVKVGDTLSLDMFYRPGTRWVKYTACAEGVCINPPSTEVHTWASFRNGGVGVHIDSIVGDVELATKVVRMTKVKVTTYNGTKAFLGAGFWNVRQGIDTSTGDGTGSLVVSPSGVATNGIVTIYSRAQVAPAS